MGTQTSFLSELMLLDMGEQLHYYAYYKPSECFLIYNCENKNDEKNKSVVFHSLK